MEGDVILVRKWAPKFKPGDIVTFKYQNQVLIKRLIALSNSESFIDNFQVIVDDHPYLESKDHPPLWDKNVFECRYSEVTKTGENQYYVLGDNRCHSSDSRHIGPVGRENIQGEVIFTLKQNDWALLRAISLL